MTSAVMPSGATQLPCEVVAYPYCSALPTECSSVKPNSSSEEVILSEEGHPVALGRELLHPVRRGAQHHAAWHSYSRTIDA